MFHFHTSLQKASKPRLSAINAITNNVFLQLFNHYSGLKNRWGLYRLESKQKNKCEMGRQPHCEPQTCTPGVNYILMESCMRAYIHKHSHHFGSMKYMHTHNKQHEGMQPYVLPGKCKLAHMLSVCGDQPVTTLASLQLYISGVKQVSTHHRFSTAPFSTFMGRLVSKLSIVCFNIFIHLFICPTGLPVYCTRDN